MRTLEWNAESGEMIMIDQRILPARFERVICRTAEDTAEAIRNMTVRGAPAIGVSAAYGMALALLRARTDSADALWAELERAGALLTAARPTAVNLAWAVQRVLAECQPARGSAAALREKVVAVAERMADEDVEVNRRISAFGAELIQDGDTIIHHCNTGALATVDWGTALGVIRMAHEQGKRVHVLVDEIGRAHV